MSNSEVIISIAFSETERSEAVQFIEHEMRKNFDCDPPATTGVVFIARLSEKIVGSLALQGSKDGRGLPIENHYRFDYDHAPFAISRDLIVQASRWIALQNGVSLQILQASFNLAYSLGKRYVLIEAKPYSIKRLIELGVIGEQVQGATLHLGRIQDEVGEKGMKYFLEAPFPILYMIDLQKSIASLG